MVNYLYNGIPLPDINAVWMDKENYPHACIVVDESYAEDGEYSAYLLLAGLPMFVTESTAYADGEYDIVACKAPTVRWLWKSLNEETGQPWNPTVWETSLQQEVDKQNDYLGDADYFIRGIGTKQRLLWASHNIYTADTGTLYLAASEPVPVSETSGSLRKGSLRCSTLKLLNPTNNTGDGWVQKQLNNSPVPDTYPLEFQSSKVWTDGTNVYYSDDGDNYVLNGDTWETKTWNGYTEIDGGNVWTDGTNVYYSNEDAQYVLNGDSWETKTWNGSATNIVGGNIWSDGTNFYCSRNGNQYVLNGDVWETKEWGLGKFTARALWSDGTNVYWSIRQEHYVLNGDTWEVKEWNGLDSFNGTYIWSDGVNIYYSSYDYQYVLNGDTWEPKVWGGYTYFNALDIWNDGTNIYCSYDNEHYILTSNSESPSAPSTSTIHLLSGISGWRIGQLVRSLKRKKKPVAYSYNGVRLPDINPRWELANTEKEKLYAAICYVEYADGEMHIELWFTVLPFVYDGSEIKTNVGYYSTDQLLTVDGMEWYGGYSDRFGTRKINPTDYIWTSHDILNEDGTVFLAASTPIPIYE